MSRILILSLALFALPAAAETYKWVDQHGVINYSNTPPAGVKAAKPLPIEERVSVVESDEATKAAAALRKPSAYQEALEKEWLQRQKLMALANAAQQEEPPSSAYPYAIPVFAAPRIRPTRVIHRPVNRNPPSKARLLQLQLQR